MKKPGVKLIQKAAQTNCKGVKNKENEIRNGIFPRELQFFSIPINVLNS
jgi:hypothetical protein